MKLIDEKGKLFGKINIIDFMVILFLFCMLPAFYFGYKILNRGAAVPVEVEKTSIDVYAAFKNLTPEAAELISIGDKEIDDGGNVIGEILAVNRIEPNFIEIVLGEGNTIVKEDAQKKQVTVKMNLVGRLDGNDIFYKENKIKIGSTIDFKTDKYEAKGIIALEVSRTAEVSKAGFNAMNLSLLFKNLSPEIANLISVGDFEADKSGNTIAKVLTVGRPEPYSYKVDLGGGNYITRTDPQKKQLLTKVEIMGRIEGNAFYFRDKRIALDSEIEFNTNKYDIKGIVIKEPVSVKPSVKLPINVDFLFKNLSPEIANLISVGDFEADKSGNTIAKVLTVGRPEPYSYKVDLGGGNYITRTDPQKKQLLTKVEIMGRIEGNAFYFKDKRIALDSIIEFDTNKYKIEGVVSKEPASVKRVDKKWVALKVKFTNLMPELAVLINEGDEERELSGELVAKVTSILSNEAADVVIQQGGGMEVVKHPINKDVILSIEALCTRAQKGLLFRESRIKVGNNLSLQTEKYDIEGIIIGIEGAKDLR